MRLGQRSFKRQREPVCNATMSQPEPEALGVSPPVSPWSPAGLGRGEGLQKESPWWPDSLSNFATAPPSRLSTRSPGSSSSVRPRRQAVRPWGPSVCGESCPGRPQQHCFPEHVMRQEGKHNIHQVDSPHTPAVCFTTPILYTRKLGFEVAKDAVQRDAPVSPAKALGSEAW